MLILQPIILQLLTIKYRFSKLRDTFSNIFVYIPILNHDLCVNIHVYNVICVLVTENK